MEEKPLLIVSKKFIDGFCENEGEFCYISPYSSSNIIIQLRKDKDDLHFEIYKYIYDPLEPELKYINSFQQDSKVSTALTEIIKIWFLLPGKQKNKIFIISRKLNIWSCIIDSKGKFVSYKLLINKKGFSDFEHLLEDFFNTDFPYNIIPYFIKDQLIGLVIFSDDECLFVLNRKKPHEENLFSFPYDKEYTSEDNGNLYINLFSSENGISVIKSSIRIINHDFPFQIKKFEQAEIPIDLVVQKDCLYVIEKNQMKKYPYLNKVKGKKKCECKENIVLGWLSPIDCSENLLIEDNDNFFLKSTILNSMDYNLNLKNLAIHNESEFELTIDKESLILFKLANNNFGFIYDGKKFIFWSNLSYIRKFTHNKSNYLIKIHEIKPYDALESLKRMQDIGFDLELMAKMFEDAVPQIFKQRKRVKRKSYTREEDLFILDHIYEDLTISQIAEKINHPKSSVTTRFMNVYGTPSCDEHFQIEVSCEQCQENLIAWKNEVKEKILQKEYRIREYTDIELCELYSRKERSIRSRTLDLRSKITPEVHDNIIKFVGQIDCAGKSYRKLFLQSLRLFIGKKIEDNGIVNIKPSNLISMYFAIKPDMKLLRKLRRNYKRIVGKEPYFLSDKQTVFIKAINSLGKLFDINTIERIKPVFIEVLKNIDNPKIGTLPAVLYLLSKKKLTQKEISNCFNTTEVSLRSESRNIWNNHNLMQIIYDYKKTLSIEIKTNKQLENDEKLSLDIVNQKIKLFYSTFEYEKIPSIISNLQLQFKEKNYYIILKSIEKLSRVDDRNIVHSLVKFLIKNNCCNDKIFDNLVVLLGSEEDSIIQDILKLISFYKPEFKNYDVYKIIKNLSREQNIRILSYIQKNQLRISKHKSIKEYIQDTLSLFIEE